MLTSRERVERERLALGRRHATKDESNERGGHTVNSEGDVNHAGAPADQAGPRELLRRHSSYAEE